MILIDPMEVVLAHIEVLELNEAQVERIGALHEESLERTAEARKTLEPMLERMEQMQDRRGEMGQRGQMGQRGERGQRRQMGQRGQSGPGMMGAEMREAVQLLREERQATMAQLRETLSREQLQTLREILRELRPGPRPGR